MAYIKVNIENGYYLFKLRDLLKEKNVSINKIMRDTDTDYKVLRRLMNGDSIKIDLYVIARICSYLNCNFEDIIEYKRDK